MLYLTIIQMMNKNKAKPGQMEIGYEYLCNRLANGKTREEDPGTQGHQEVADERLERLTSHRIQEEENGS